MKTSLPLLVVASLAIPLAGGACGEHSQGTCEETLSCGPAVDGGDVDGDVVPDGGGDVVQPPAGCDPNAEPKDAPKCVVSEFGVFADATTGSDANAGTRESPVRTIAAALSKIGAKPRIYICDGSYAEAVEVTSGVSIYGGFACTSWTYDGTKAKIAPSARGVALGIANVSSSVVVADLDVTAQDASEPSESSTAIFIANSSQVTMRRVTAKAGKGMNGSDAASKPDFTGPAPNGTSGAAGGSQTPNPMCTTSIGGAGGNNTTSNGATGTVAIDPVYPAGYSGSGGMAGAACFAADGSFGVAGAPGTGAVALGTLDANGWKGADGADGGKGGDGQGGGGGGQKVAGNGAVGGGGGPGGCGGAGGAKGTAGGSSIALLVVQAAVALEECALVSKDAGRGGNGGKGQKGQLGPQDFAQPSNINACAGGVGGIGGSGGGGGGGAGGISAGILYKGAAPKIGGIDVASAETHGSVTVGLKGASGQKGPGGDAAQTSAPASRGGTEGTDGIAGETKAVMSAP